MAQSDDASDSNPSAVLHLWQVPPRNVPRALLLMATQRRAVHALPFGKLLGTGSGGTFASRDVNWRQYALLTSWPTGADAARFDESKLVRQWQRISSSQRRIELLPLASRGTWSGRTPFSRGTSVSRVDGPVASITHARITPRRILAFWRAVPAVASDLVERGGSTFRLAIGEMPVGIQGTFSMWASEADMTAFAYGPAHREVIRRRADERWYAEEIFARLVVTSDVLVEFPPPRPVQ